MIYNVASLLTGNLGDSEQHEIENEKIVIDGFSLQKINGSVRLMRTDATVLVSGKFESVMHSECVRCLDPATVNVNVTMEEEFSPTNASLMDETSSRPDEEDYSFDPTLVIDEQNSLDLTEGLGQAFLSALPIAILCKEDCLGICPICTVNRNIIQCSCAKSSVDPRWAGLAGLIGKGAESSN
jgi:uncharacterized protein